jgi:hypothetical protein
VDPDLEDLCRDFLKELSDQEYKDFVTRHQQNPDGIDIILEPGNRCHYDGYPFDKKLFSETSFRVIPETMMSYPIISEKTWITIANRLPFMIVGYPNTLCLLKDLGFKTFEKYLPVDNYDAIMDDEQRLDAVIKNTEYWLSNIDSHRDAIVADIEFNFQLLSKKIKDTADRFEEIYHQLGDTTFERFRILPITLQRANWINLYYGIKDPSWPDCWDENDVSKLPQHVQQEMKEIHGYRSRHH